MKRWIWTALVILGLSGIAGPDAGHAGDLSSSQTLTASASSVSSASGGSGTVIDGRYGGYAAVGCGLFGRALGGGMVNVGTIAGAIATCGYMFFDALFAP